MTAMIERLAHRGRRTTWVVPAACGLVSAALLVASAAVAASEPGVRGVPTPDDVGWWWALAVLLAQAVLLGALRGRPRAALLAVAAVVPALLVLGDAIGVGLVPVAVGVVLVVLARPVRPLAATLAGAGALVAVGVAATELRLGGSGWVALGAGLLQGVGGVGLPALLASVVASRRDAVAALAESVEAQERERDALVQVAVERERTAMARELHDIAAHHLSGIAVMTAAIGRQIDVDPAGAKQSVAQVREQSTAMLRDLRSLVGLLREADGAAGDQGAVRVETLAGVAELVARAQAAGQEVALETSGPVAELASSGAVGPLAQLAAFRVVQEALANAARHAPGARCTVTVDARPGTVDVVVRNDAPARGAAPVRRGAPGYGLVGMRERAELTGATLRHGPQDDGGWRVALAIPVATPTQVAR